MENDDIFGMLTAKTEEMPSDKPEKPKEEKKSEPVKAKEKAAAPEPKKPGEKKASKNTFTAPFQLYMGSRLRDVTGLFDDGKEYTGDEITKIMIANGEYFFTGKIEYDYMPETNTVVAMSIQHKKG